MSLRRALDYPYEIPERSYVIKNGESCAYEGCIDLDGRVPVLACGSNQSPVQLKRKFPDGIIPVMAGWLQDYDSVYSAHFTSYGSVAATYHHIPNVRSRQMVTWLSEEQLRHMHATEALGINYDYVEMTGFSFVSDDGVKLTHAFAYASTRGPLCFDGEPIGLTHIIADNRPYRSMNEETLQGEILKRISYGGSLETFIRENIASKDVRSRHTDQLVALSLK